MSAQAATRPATWVRLPTADDVEAKAFDRGTLLMRDPGWNVELTVIGGVTYYAPCGPRHVKSGPMSTEANPDYEARHCAGFPSGRECSHRHAATEVWPPAGTGVCRG